MEHRQRYRLNPLYLLPALLVLVCASSLTACQTPAGGTAPTALQTFDAIYTGALQGETLALQATTAALTSKLITAPQAQKVEAALDATKAILDAAHGAALAGSTGVATANLSQAVGSIALVSACLTAKPLTPTTFDACLSKMTFPMVVPT